MTDKRDRSDQSNSAGGLRLLPTGEPVSTGIVLTIAEETGRPVTELPPLYNSIDPDALDALFAGRQNGKRQIQIDGSTENEQTESDSKSGWVRFDFADYRVTVYADETFELEPLS